MSRDAATSIRTMTDLEALVERVADSEPAVLDYGGRTAIAIGVLLLQEIAEDYEAMGAEVPIGTLSDLAAAMQRVEKEPGIGATVIGCAGYRVALVSEQRYLAFADRIDAALSGDEVVARIAEPAITTTIEELAAAAGLPTLAADRGPGVR